MSKVVLHCVGTARVATARLFAAEGARVLLIDRDAAKLAAAAESLASPDRVAVHIARTALFLASDARSFGTAGVYLADDGMDA
jgi:NAD(P)-dependent dehydrogenase (short-subunit alcohol dehydrogenase family)